MALSPTPDRPTEEEERVLENHRVKVRSLVLLCNLFRFICYTVVCFHAL